VFPRLYTSVHSRIESDPCYIWYVFLWLFLRNKRESVFNNQSIGDSKGWTVYLLNVRQLPPNFGASRMQITVEIQSTNNLISSRALHGNYRIFNGWTLTLIYSHPGDLLTKYSLVNQVTCNSVKMEKLLIFLLVLGLFGAALSVDNEFGKQDLTQHII